jgi:hypothetical protein
MNAVPKLESFTKPFNFYVTVIFACVGIIFIWRGTWNLLDKYFFPDKFLLSNLLSICFGLILLVLFADLSFLN